MPPEGTLRRVSDGISMLIGGGLSTEGAVTSIDPYRVTDTLDDAVLDTIVTRLEVRGRHPVFVRMLDEYLDAMGIDDAKAVIDLGCGTGIASRHIARRPGFSGHVTGIDQSPSLIGAANRFADDENLAGRIDFRIGDTQRLDLGAGEFDAVVAHTLISHVRAPRSRAGRNRPHRQARQFDRDLRRRLRVTDLRPSRSRSGQT